MTIEKENLPKKRKAKKPEKLTEIVIARNRKEYNFFEDFDEDSDGVQRRFMVDFMKNQEFEDEYNDTYNMYEDTRIKITRGNQAHRLKDNESSEDPGSALSIPKKRETNKPKNMKIIKRGNNTNARKLRRKYSNIYSSGSEGGDRDDRTS